MELPVLIKPADIAHRIPISPPFLSTEAHPGLLSVHTYNLNRHNLMRHMAD